MGHIDGNILPVSWKATKRLVMFVEYLELPEAAWPAVFWWRQKESLGLALLVNLPAHSGSLTSTSPPEFCSRVARTLVQCSLCLTISWWIKFDYLFEFQ